jgi:hypothetical protein
LESLASSTESGFRNLSSQIEGIGRQFTSSRPQLGVIATILISTCALVGALVGFVIKSSVIPLERDTAFNRDQITRVETELGKDVRLITDPLVFRIQEVERRLQQRISDSDDRQDAEILAMRKICDQIIASALQSQLSHPSSLQLHIPQTRNP